MNFVIKCFTVYIFRGSGLSRAAYAKLYSVGFPPVLDRNGEPPEVIDPNTHMVTVDLQREMNDTLQCNEVIFQFLAFSKYVFNIFPWPTAYLNNGLEKHFVPLSHKQNTT